MQSINPHSLTSDDWRLPQRARIWLADRIWPKPILELGVGEGTRTAASLGRVYAVDDDQAWLTASGVPPEDAVCCPLVDGWYSLPPLMHFLADKHYGVVVVDGPVNHRAKFLAHEHLFADVPILIDDVHRALELDMARAVASRRNETLSVHCLTDGRAFAVVGRI